MVQVKKKESETHQSKSSHQLGASLGKVHRSINMFVLRQHETTSEIGLGFPSQCRSLYHNGVRRDNTLFRDIGLNDVIVMIPFPFSRVNQGI